MRKLWLGMAVVALLIGSALGASSTLTNAQEQNVEAWSRALLQGGNLWNNPAFAQGSPALYFDTLKMAQGRICDTFVTRAGVYNPILWVDDPQFSMNLRILNTERGVAFTTLVVPDSAMPILLGGPLKQLIVYRPSGDTGTACFINMLGLIAEPKTPLGKTR